MPHLTFRPIRLLATALLTATVGTAALTVPAQAAITVPSAPRSFAVAQTAAGTVKVTWSAPSSDGGSAITSYNVGFSAGQWGNGTTVGPTARSVVFGDLAKGTYTFSAWATNAKGDGPHVSKSFTVTTGAPAPSIAVSATTVVAGGSLTLHGLGYPNSYLTLERKLPGRSYVAIGDGVQTDADGAWTNTRTVKNTASYRIRGGSGAVSAGKTVTVKSRVTLTATRTGTRAYTLSGTVYPALASQVVTLTTRQADGSWYTLGTVKTDSTGAWSYARTYSAARTYTFRATAAATTVNAAGSATMDVPVS